MKTSVHFGLLLTLTLVMMSCSNKDSTSSKGAGKKAMASEMGIKAKGASAPRRPAYPLPGKLVEQDLSKQAAKHIPTFKGTLKARIPEGSTFSKGVARLVIKAKGFGMSIGSDYHVKHAQKKLKTGKWGLVKQAEIVESSDKHLIYKGKVFGKLGYHVHTNLPALGMVKSGCQSNKMDGVPLANARKILEACLSVKYTP